MSLVKALATIGANSKLRYTTEKKDLDLELQELIDTCPDIIAFLAPAEDESEAPAEDTPDTDEEEKESISKAS